jgi:hypothetical protein
MQIGAWTLVLPLFQGLSASQHPLGDAAMPPPLGFGPPHLVPSRHSVYNACGGMLRGGERCRSGAPALLGAASVHQRRRIHRHGLEPPAGRESASTPGVLVSRRGVKARQPVRGVLLALRRRARQPGVGVGGRGAAACVRSGEVGRGGGRGDAKGGREAVAGREDVLGRVERRGAGGGARARCRGGVRVGGCA